MATVYKNILQTKAIMLRAMQRAAKIIVALKVRFSMLRFMCD